MDTKDQTKMATPDIRLRRMLLAEIFPEAKKNLQRIPERASKATVTIQST